MNHARGSQAVQRISAIAFVIMQASAWFIATPDGVTAPPTALIKEFSITVDATGLTPPTRWQVPGFTPMIMSLDPDTSDAYRTTERKELKLKPGKYRFGTFTFDFPFAVTLEGKLEFAQSLDQCVDGRGTQTLTVHCTRTVPYGGVRDY